MTNILFNMIIILGCAIIFALISIILAFTYYSVKSIALIAKEARKECSAAKDVPIDMSAVTNYAKNTDEKKPSTDE